MKMKRYWQYKQYEEAEVWGKVLVATRRIIFSSRVIYLTRGVAIVKKLRRGRVTSNPAKRGCRTLVLPRPRFFAFQ